MAVQPPPQGFLVCPKCHVALVHGVQFCPRCGASLAPRPGVVGGAQNFIRGAQGQTWRKVAIGVGAVLGCLVIASLVGGVIRATTKPQMLIRWAGVHTNDHAAIIEYDPAKPYYEFTLLGQNMTDQPAHFRIRFFASDGTELGWEGQNWGWTNELKTDDRSNILQPSEIGALQDFAPWSTAHTDRTPRVDHIVVEKAGGDMTWTSVPFTEENKPVF